MRGRLITVEGGEGAGKSSCLGELAAVLEASGIEHVQTREPGGTRLGEMLRSMLLDDQQSLAVETELLLMFAARAQNLHEVILPALAAGRWVISDRFTDASYAYQGAGRGIDAVHIEYLERWVQGHVRPDLTILLDLPAERGLARAVANGRPDRIEQEKMAFHQRVREAYLARAQADHERFRLVDAGQPLAQVCREVRRAVAEFIDAVREAGN